ncbi:MAG: hydrogenase iron-sulfur subunit [Candidatus Eisenbacteria bacterium]|nr:hydrogenase iron-sulfur subunit [Candidatus Eisenbacteria bacterium]
MAKRSSARDAESRGARGSSGKARRGGARSARGSSGKAKRSSARGASKAPGRAGDDRRDFDPRVVAFACNWCSYPAADAAGINKMQYPPNARIIRVMCAGRVHPAFVLKALELGADGVLVSGCHFADCHYLFGAKRAAEQFEKAARLVSLLGLEAERVRFEQISAAEAPKFVRVMQEFVEDLRRLGPSPLGRARDEDLHLPGVVGEERT